MAGAAGTGTENVRWPVTQPDDVTSEARSRRTGNVRFMNCELKGKQLRDGVVMGRGKLDAMDLRKSRRKQKVAGGSAERNSYGTCR